jgi:hypothetical protein
MIETFIFVLVLLQIKHWYIDFVNQNEEEVKHKGIYLDWLGIKHSLKHGIGTLACLWTVTGWANIEFAFFIGVLDFILHYHIDWTKMNYGNRDITTPQFWNHLGLDQMAHQLCYIAFAGLTLL